MTRSATLTLCLGLAAASEPSTIVINVGTQTGFFQTRTDIGSLNPHDYRPNEFVTSDFIYEGLTEWDGSTSGALGLDGVTGTEDDYVAPSLASSWTTGWVTDSTGICIMWEITFTLRSGVTFHDGSAWDAAACKGNFDQIMGGDGTSRAAGGTMALRGMHDWMGFTQSLDGWSIVDSMTFKLTFTTYYEAALRELAFIRPFRMISLASLPSMADMELSMNAWRGGSPRVFGGYTMRAVSNPIGTGPYQVIKKTLVKADGSTRDLAAADFNASCYTNDACAYNAGEWVSEVLFTKVAGHRKAPTYDNVILRAYNSNDDVKAALQNGTLDVAYGVSTLSTSASRASSSASSSTTSRLPTSVRPAATARQPLSRRRRRRLRRRRRRRRHRHRRRRRRRRRHRHRRRRRRRRLRQTQLMRMRATSKTLATTTTTTISAAEPSRASRSQSLSLSLRPSRSAL